MIYDIDLTEGVYLPFEVLKPNTFWDEKNAALLTWKSGLRDRERTVVSLTASAANFSNLVEDG